MKIATSIPLMLLAMSLATTGCLPQRPPAAGDDDDTPGDDDDSTGDDDTTEDEPPADDDDTPDPPVDADGDGWGADQGDCDDADPLVHPHADEQPCNGVDDDCDGQQPEVLAVPSDYPAIADAIAASADGDVVCVDPGLYRENLDFGGRDIQVIGAGGADVTFIDAGAAGPGVTFASGEGPDALLAGFTIYDGLAEAGAGIVALGASPTLRELVVEDNDALSCGGVLLFDSSSRLQDLTIQGNRSAVDGGGLCAVGGWPDLERLHVEGNTTVGNGGGVYLWLTGATIQDSRFEGNVANHGGGIYAQESTLTLSHARLAGNEALEMGGGLYATLASQVDAEQLLAAGNVGGLRGGGVYIGKDSAASLSHAVIVDNQAEVGGGLRSWWAAETTLDHCVVAGNQAYDGGGIGLYEAQLQMSHVAIVGNQADDDGGGLDTDGTSNGSSWDQVIFAHNSAGDHGGGIYDHNSPSVSRSAFFGNTPDDAYGMTDPVGVDGNVASDPGFVDRTGDVAEGWDLHLGIASPLVDAGDPSASDPDGSIADIGPYGGPQADQFDLDGDGYPRAWQPGGYAAVAGNGDWDCDDLDAAVHPGNGC